MEELEKLNLVAKTILENPKDFFEHQNIKIDYGSCHVTYHHPIDYDVKVILNSSDNLILKLDDYDNGYGVLIVLVGIIENGEVIS